MVDARVVRAFLAVRVAGGRGDPVMMLAALHQLERAARAARATRAEQAASAVVDGLSYAELARRLGVSRQAAVKAYGPVVARLLRARIRG